VIERQIHPSSLAGLREQQESSKEKVEVNANVQFPQTVQMG